MLRALHENVIGVAEEKVGVSGYRRSAHDDVAVFASEQSGGASRDSFAVDEGAIPRQIFGQELPRGGLARFHGEVPLRDARMTPG